MKQLFLSLGFSAKENSTAIFTKKYADDYAIEIDCEKKTINYGNKIVCKSKTTCNFSQPENFVVLECVNRLLEKGYKPEHITLEKTWSAGHGTSGRLDICVTREDGSEFLLIECKTYGGEFEKAVKKLNKDGGQLFTYFKFSNKADIIMLYASELQGENIVYKNEIIKIEDDHRTGDAKDFYEKWNKLTKNNGIFEDGISPYNFQSKALIKSQLIPISQEDSSFIFNHFLEILRHNVVSDKGNAFNKIFTLFLCKVYDEKTSKDDEELKFQWIEGVDDHVSFQLRLTDLYKNGMLEFLEKEVSDFNQEDFDQRCKSLSEENKQFLMREVNKLRLEKNNEFAVKEVYDHESFVENAKVVKEIVELLQGFRLRYNKRQQYLSDFFELLLTTGLKQESGQFFTPVPVAQFIIKSLPLDDLVEEKLKAGKVNELLPFIIDYAAGSGHFLTESMHEIQRLLNQKSPNNFIESTAKKIRNWQDDHFDWATQYVYGIEKDYRLVKVGKVGCYLHGDGLANVILSDGLANFGHKDYKQKLAQQNADNPQENKQFDIVISNPPYSVSSFVQTTRSYYNENDFDLYNFLTDNSSEIECLFIERTKQLLKDGGIAGIILPESVLEGEKIYSKTRKLILKYFEIVAITKLGKNTFMATDVKTVILFLRKRNNYDNIHFKRSIRSFFTNLQDITVNGIEKPFSKYVKQVWGTTFEDYISLLKQKPNKTIESHEIYKEYKTKIKKEFWTKVIDIEKEKLLYFVLTFPQKIVVVKSGEKDVEKQFLGYEFSNRMGSEGIHSIYENKTIENATLLFDDETFSNPKKISTYIYNAFKGNLDLEIDTSLTAHIEYSNLVELINFSPAKFEMKIEKKEKLNIDYEQLWGTTHLQTLNDISTIEKGKSITKKKTVKGDIPVIAGGQVPAYFHNESNREANVITISASGAYSGFANFFDVPIFASDCNTIVSLNENEIPTKFIFYILKSIQPTIYKLQRGQAQPHVYGNDLEKIKIPIFKKGTIFSVFKEIEELEEKAKTVVIENIDELKLKIIKKWLQ